MPTKDERVFLEQSEKYGNKSANLQELQKVFTAGNVQFNGLSVPEFYSLSDDFIQTFLDQCVPKWREVFEQFKTTQQSKESITKEASQALKELRNLISGAFCRYVIEAPEVQAFLRKIEESNAQLMVRSTGEEDAADIANPGGNTSVAGVSPNIKAVTKAIGMVIASYFSEKSLKQRLLDADGGVAKRAFMPVLLQRMIGEPYNGATDIDGIVRSGVMYTSGTFTKIQAAFGHGEGVVNNKLLVDTYKVTREKIIYSEIANKKDRLVPTQQGLQSRENPVELQKNSPALSDSVVLRLEKAAKAIQSYYGEDMDVEFVYYPPEDMIYLVQARPIPVGKIKSIVPCSIPPDKIPELNTLIQAQQIIKHEAIVIVSAGFSAKVVTKPRQLLVCDTIEDALDCYLTQNNSAVCAVIVKESAGSTSHAAAQFSLQAIPVLQVANQNDIYAWLAQEEGLALIIDPQRGQVLQWYRAMGSEEKAISLLADGLFTYPVVPVTASRVFVQAPSVENNNQSLGVAIRANPEAELFKFLSKVDGAIKFAKDKWYTQLLQAIDSLEAVRINHDNVQAFDALQLVRFIIFRLAQAEFNLLPILERVLVLCEEIERSLNRYQNATADVTEHLNLVALLRSLVVYKGDQSIFSDSIMQIMQEKKAQKQISLNKKLIPIQRDYLTQFLKLTKIMFGSAMQESWKNFAAFCVNTPDTIKKLAVIIQFSVKNQIESYLMNDMFRQYIADGLSFPDILEQLHEDCIQSQHTLQHTQISQAQQVILVWERKVNDWSFMNKFDVLWEQYQQEIVPLIQILCVRENNTVIKQIIGKNEESDDDFDDNEGTELAFNNWSCHVVEPDASKEKILKTVRTPFGYVAAGEKLYFVHKDKRVCVLSRMNLRSYQLTIKKIVQFQGRRNGLVSVYSGITGTVDGGLGSILRDHNFVNSNRLDVLSQTIIFRLSLRLTELMDQSVKKLKGSVEYKEDKSLLLKRMAQLLEPYHQWMCSWIQEIPDFYFKFWASYTAYGAGDRNTKKAILGSISSAFKRCSASSDIKQLKPSNTMSIATTVIGTMGSFSRQFPIQDVTLDDLFSLFHQNILSAISIVSGSNQRDLNTFPDELHNMLRIFQATDLDLLHITHNHPHLVLEYNLPLGNHGMKLLLDYDQNIQKIKVSAYAFGHFSGNEIRDIAHLFQLEAMLLDVVVKKQPDYSEKSHTLHFIWEIDFHNLNEFADAFADGISQYRDMLCHNRDWESLLYEPIYDRLLKRHPSIYYERLKPVLSEMRTNIIQSRQSADGCRWKYDGSYLATKMLATFGCSLSVSDETIDEQSSPVNTNHLRNEEQDFISPQVETVQENSQTYQPDKTEPIVSKESVVLEVSTCVSTSRRLKDVISKDDFETILNTYKSRSILGYLSTFWIFSWISPTRSQTMLELKLLLSLADNQEINRTQITTALSKGDRAVHRIGLFNGNNQVVKDGTGTDEVVIALRDSFNQNK